MKWEKKRECRGGEEPEKPRFLVLSPSNDKGSTAAAASASTTLHCDAQSSSNSSRKDGAAGEEQQSSSPSKEAKVAPLLGFEDDDDENGNEKGALPRPSSSASAPSSSNYLDGPPGLYSLDADSHVLFLPGLFGEEEGKRGRGESDSLFLRLREEVSWQQRDVTVFGRTTPQRRLVAYHNCREGRLPPYRYSGLTLEPERATRTVMEVLAEIERAAAERCDIFLPPASPSSASPASASSSAEGNGSVPPRLFNSCLLNLYRGGSDCMGWHADDEAVYYSSSSFSSSSPSSSASFARKPSSSSSLLPTSKGDGYGGDIVIASASFGDRRDFYLRPKPAAKNMSKNGAAAAAAAATEGEQEQGKNKEQKVRYSLGKGDVLLMLGQTQSRFQHSVPARANARGERINLTFRWNCQVGGEAPRVVCKRFPK